jgi:hypothetical protein
MYEKAFVFKASLQIPCELMLKNEASMHEKKHLYVKSCVIEMFCKICTAANVPKFFSKFCAELFDYVLTHLREMHIVYMHLKSMASHCKNCL